MDVADQTKKTKLKLKQPSRYQVVLLNDDYTPMDFVVLLLQKFFMMDINQATAIMMKIHTEGRGICGIYNKDIAETRRGQINDFAREHKHILRSIIEKLN